MMGSTFLKIVQRQKLKIITNCFRTPQKPQHHHLSNLVLSRLFSSRGGIVNVSSVSSKFLVSCCQLANCKVISKRGTAGEAPLIIFRGIGTSSYAQFAQESNKEKDLAGDKILNVKLKATRLDAVLKAGLGLSRNKIEKALYDDRVRVNGERPDKKSQSVFEGDEIDIVRGPNSLNPDHFIDVARVEILKMEEAAEDDSSGDEDDEDTKIPAVLKRSKNLTIKNYSKSWKGSSQD